MSDIAKRIAVLAAGHGVVDYYLPGISVALPVLIPIFALQGIMSYAIAGFLVTVITITLAAVQPVAGWLQDRGRVDAWRELVRTADGGCNQSIFLGTELLDTSGSRGFCGNR